MREADFLRKESHKTTCYRQFGKIRFGRRLNLEFPFKQGLGLMSGAGHLFCIVV